MDHRRWSMIRVSLAVLISCAILDLSSAWSAESESQQAMVKPSPTAQPIQITADRIEYLQNVEVYEAEGSVVIVQGAQRLTTDRATIFLLTGTLVATGQVHLTDLTTDLRADRLELDVNTDAGVVTNGKLYIKESNTLVTGRLLQRFSESHFRAKDGSFTNCDAQDGRVPAWRFTFEDVDLSVGEGVYARNAWFCVNDVPLLKLPTMFYPIQTARKTGLLIPTVGYDNRFGLHYRQSFFWAVNPSQDVTITPDYLSNLGYGGDLEYRYVLDRLSRGQWLVSFLQQQKLPNVQGVQATGEDAKRTRALISGLHRQQVNPDLSIRAQAFLVTDPEYLQQLSNSGAQRALPTGESFLNINQRLSTGNLYLLGQYLQPLAAGGPDSFQRLPEIGHRIINVAPLGGPMLLGMETTAVHFYRDEGFTLDRVDVLPSIGTETLSLGHMLGLRPQVKARETYYTNNVTNSGSVHRETFWAGIEGVSRLSRRFRLGEGRSVLHTVEPKVVYEYVPSTDQSDIVRIDDVDDLPKKNLITYSLTSRLLEQRTGAASNSWLDLMVAQSYHPGSTPNQARDFFFVGSPPFGTVTQPLQPPLVPVQVKKFSDVWMRAVIGNPVGPLRALDQMLMIDAFVDPYQGGFSQFNTDLRFQHQREWYVEVGQRFARGGNRPRRGDIWNPISFNEVFAPTRELNFVTLGAAFRGPFGLIFGGRTYYDLRRKESPETDVVALYRNPCQCWSVGVYYIQFPDRVQYNFMVSLTGVGATENFGTQLMRYLLGPLVIGERGLPWPSPYGRRTTSSVSPAAVGTSIPSAGP